MEKTPPGISPGDGEGATLGGPLDRREFLRLAGAGAGLYLISGCADDTQRGLVPGLTGRPTRRATSRSPDVVVIGAGAFGGWTALNLLRMGARVTLVDAYGPGNSRATSGDETRGIRTSYGDRSTGELWMQWAREAIRRWELFDEEWGKEYKWNVYFRTGDLLMRSGWEPFLERNRDMWDKFKIPYEVLTPDEVRYRWPVINIDGINIILHETEAGVARARRSCQAVAAVVEKLGGRVVTARASLGPVVDGKLQNITLDNGEVITAGSYVFACGPWLGKVFPELMGNRMRIPMGYVAYFATPPGDHRYGFPYLPSFNFPGVTGWPSLPVDARGLRVRGGSAAGGGAGRAGGAGAAGTQGAAGGARAGGAGAAGGAQQGGAGARGGGAAGGGRQGGAQGGGRGAATPPPPQTPEERAAAEAAAAAAAAQAARQNDPDFSDRLADAARMAGPRNFLAQRFPELANTPMNETRACHYESTSSRNFVIDTHPDMGNVWISGGGNAEGFKFGPVVGEYTAQRVLGDLGDPEIAKGFGIPEETYSG